jgi:hypothetical protein
MLMINITFRIGRPLQAANVIVQVRQHCEVSNSIAAPPGN